MENSLTSLKKELTRLHTENVEDIKKTAKLELITCLQEKADEIREIIDSKKQQEINFRKQIETENEAFTAQKLELEVFITRNILIKQNKLDSAVNLTKSLHKELDSAKYETEQKLLEITKLKFTIEVNFPA